MLSRELSPQIKVKLWKYDNHDLLRLCLMRDCSGDSPVQGSFICIEFEKNDNRDLLLSAALSRPPHVFVFEARFNHELFLNELNRIYRICRISKIFLQRRCIQTCYLLSNKPWCFHSTRKTQVTEKIFKMNLIHASVISQILWIHWIEWKFVPFRKNSINLLRLMVESPLKNNHLGAPA